MHHLHRSSERILLDPVRGYKAYEGLLALRIELQNVTKGPVCPRDESLYSVVF